MTTALEHSWLSDDPHAHAGEAQLFGTSILAQRVLELLQKIRLQGKSTTLGLIGSWGSGKTTVIQDITDRMSGKQNPSNAILAENWSIAHFNPWLHSDTPGLHVEFFAALRSALPRDHRWKETRNDLISLGKRLAPLSALTSLIGVSSDQAVSSLLDQFSVSTAEQHARVAKQLAELDHPVLVVIDDLDRLTAEELLQVFKLVRLVGRLPNVYYLLSYDEQTIVDLLGQTDLVSAKDDRRALNYLEKIVQVRLDVPLLREYEVDRVTARSFEHIIQKHNIELSVSDFTDLIRRFDNILSERLRTPRSIKRYFGQLDALTPSLGEEVQFKDFAVLTWMRTFEPGVYNLIQTSKNELLGRGGDPLRALSRPKPTYKELRDEWLTRLGSARVAPESQDDLLYLLTTLFPQLRQVYTGDDRRAGEDRNFPEPRDRSIAHIDYFDRYFMFGVPEDDIADSTVLKALEETNHAPDARHNLAKLREAFGDQPELVLRKIRSKLEHDGYDRQTLVEWLAQLHSSSTPQGTGRSRVQDLVTTIVGSMDHETAIELMRSVATNAAGAHLWGMVQHLLAGEHGAKQHLVLRHNALAVKMKPALAHFYSTHFESVLSAFSSPLDLPSEQGDLVWLWRDVDPVSLRSFLQEARTRHQWALLDELAWLVPTIVSSDHQPRISRHGELDHFAELFDLDKAAEELQELFGSTKALKHYRDEPATPRNRRGFALALLKSHRSV